MTHDPHRPPPIGPRGQPGRNQNGPDFSAQGGGGLGQGGLSQNGLGPQGFSINPADRPYQEAGEPPREPSSQKWFGRIVVGTLVMALCAGGVWYGATRARSRLNGGGVPLIQADTAPVKVKPDNPSGVSNDEAPPTYDRQAANRPQVEQLLPPPEAPMARPQPVPEPPSPPSEALPQTGGEAPERLVAPPSPLAPPADIAATPVPKTVPSIGPNAGPGAGSPTPLTRPLPQTMPADNPAPVKSTALPPVQQAAAVPPVKSKSAAMTATMTGPMRVQIAATLSPAAAQQEWHRLQHAHADLLGSLQPVIVKADIAGKGTFYRVQAGPVDNKAAAEKLCHALKTVSIGCIVVHP